MDRARPIISRLAQHLRTLSLAAVLGPLPGCGLVGVPDGAVALELVGGTSRTLAVGDTLVLVVRAVNAAGDTVPGAVISWAIIDTGAVGISLDPALGRVVGLEAGRDTIQGSYANLRTDPVVIVVVAAAAAPGPAATGPGVPSATAARRQRHIGSGAGPAERQ